MPYNYDAYSGNRQQLQGQQAPAYSTVTNTSWAGPAFGQQYKSGETNHEYVRQNLGVGGNKYSAANMAQGMLNPVGGVLEGFRGYKNFKKNRASEREQKALFESRKAEAIARNPTDWLNSVDPTGHTAQEANRLSAQGRPMSEEELNASLRTDDQNAQRAGFSKQIEDYFGSPERAGWQQSIVSNRLNQDLANVQEDYGNNLKSSVQSAAARGLRGGSVDVEGRGAVARTRDTGAIQAAQNADSASADFRNQDLQARDQLNGLVNSGDIGEADALRNSLQGISNATVAAGQRYAGQQQQRQINTFGQQQQSQAWGQGLNGIASAIDRNPNRGNSLSAWYGSGTSQGGW